MNADEILKQLLRIRQERDAIRPWTTSPEELVDLQHLQKRETKLWEQAKALYPDA